MPRRNGHSRVVQQNAHGRHHRFIVQQRLALPHQYNVRSRREPLLVLLERQQDLRQNFSSRQIANQTELRRHAKLAIHGASRLRRNTNRLPPVARHKHRLDRCRAQRPSLLCVLSDLCRKCLFPGSQLKQIPNRSVGRYKSLFDDRQRNPRFLREFFSQTRRQIRHRPKIEFSLRIQRVIDLPAAIGRLAHPHTYFPKLVFRFSKQFHRSFQGRDLRAVPPRITLQNIVFCSRISSLRGSLLLFGGIIFVPCQNNLPSSHWPSLTGSQASLSFRSAISPSKTFRTTSSATPSAPKLLRNISSSRKGITRAISFSRTIS